MTLKTMVLALAASMWMVPSLALAQGTVPTTSGPPAVPSKDVQTIRYVKYVWVNPQTKAFRVVLMDATSNKVLGNETGTGDVPPLMVAKSDPPATIENTITLYIPCGDRDAESLCAGNVNIPVSDTTPTGQDRLVQLTKKLREYHEWILTRPRIGPPPGPKPLVNPRQPAVLPGSVQNPAVQNPAVQNPATREQPR